MIGVADMSDDLRKIAIKLTLEETVDSKLIKSRDVVGLPIIWIGVPKHLLHFLREYAEWATLNLENKNANT